MKDYILGVSSRVIPKSGPCLIDAYISAENEKELLKTYISLLKEQGEGKTKEELPGITVGEFKDDHRITANFMRANMFHIDLDKDVPLDLFERLKKSGYNCFWHGSHSWTPENMKTHIYVFLDNDIEDYEIYGDNYNYNAQLFLRKLDIDCKQDAQCKDAVRSFFLPSSKAIKTFGYVINKEKWWWRVDYKSLMNKVNNPSVSIDLSTLDTTLVEVMREEGLKKIERHNWVEGTRTTDCYILSGVAASHGLTLQETIGAITRVYTNPKDKKKQLATIKDGFKKPLPINKKSLDYYKRVAGWRSKNG